MNTYEFTFLVEKDGENTQLQKELESLKGEKLDEKSWGKRLLAYPINKIKDAEFFTWHINIEPDKLADFKKKLQYDKMVIRYLIIKSNYSNKAKKATVKKVEAKKEEKK